MLAPGLLDRLLARTGVRSQLSKERIHKPRPDNLFETVSGDFGVHGRFDGRASAAPVQSVDPARLRQMVGFGLLGLVVAAATVWRQTSRTERDVRR
jgi:hypothetical protein